MSTNEKVESTKSYHVNLSEILSQNLKKKWLKYKSVGSTKVTMSEMLDKRDV